MNKKVKITCLRKHRDEIRDDLRQLKEIHEDKIKQDDEEIRKLNEVVAELRKENKDQKDELHLKSKEIENLMFINDGEQKETSNSLADELLDANWQPQSISSETLAEILNCEQCDLIFRTKAKLSAHNMTHEAPLSQKLKLLARLTLCEREASEQKVSLTSSLFSLKMKEIKEKQK